MLESDSSEDEGDKEEDYDGEMAQEGYIIGREQGRHDERDEESKFHGMGIFNEKIGGENKDCQ